MFGRMRIGTKILLVTVSITLSVIVVSLVASNYSTRAALEREAFDRLTAVRELKSQQIEDYFQSIHHQVVTFSENKMIVEPHGGTDFHVAYRGGRAGAPDFWCAAGDHVLRKLGKPGTTRIYRTTSIPRRSGKGIDFSLSPEGAKPTGLLVLFGSNRFVSAASAQAMCNQRRR